MLYYVEAISHLYSNIIYGLYIAFAAERILGSESLQLKASPFRAGMVLLASRYLFLEGFYGLWQ
jgi:hypothetical protein